MKDYKTCKKCGLKGYNARTCGHHGRKPPSRISKTDWLGSPDVRTIFAEARHAEVFEMYAAGTHAVDIKRKFPMLTLRTIRDIIKGSYKLKAYR